MALVVAVDGSWLSRAVRLLVVGALASLVIALVGRSSLRTAAATCVVTGVIAVAAGTAVGFPYLSATGWSVRTVGGLTAAVAGLVVLVAGAWAALRSVRVGARLLAIPLGLALAYLVVSPVAMAVYATTVPRVSLGDETPSERGLGYTDVAFVTSDGVTLSGWYIASTNRAAVALLHGASTTRSNVLDQAAVLARNGYGVLLFDARGAGRSGGHAMNFGWHGDRDVAAAITYLQGRPDVDPDRIGAVGESMGGEAVIGAMAADPRIRAVVAEGATNRVAGDWDWLADRYGVRGVVQQAVNRAAYALTDLLSGASAPITLRKAAVAAGSRPILLIAAGEVADEAHAGDHIRQASPGNVELWVAAGAGHTDGLQTQPAEWERRVTEFLDAALTAP